MGEAVTYLLTRSFSTSGEGVNRLESEVLAGSYRPISSPNAINRRFNCVSAVQSLDYGFSSPVRTCIASRYGDTSVAIESTCCWNSFVLKRLSPSSAGE